MAVCFTLYEGRVAHNIKKVGSRLGVQVVFSAPKKLGRLCRSSVKNGC